MVDPKNLRDILKSTAFNDIGDEIETDQEKNLPQPPVQKACDSNSKLINLIPINKINCGNMSLLNTLKKRKSRRIFSEKPLTLEELSLLLWSAQGVKKIVKNGYATLRTVPSAGARHPFETYIAVFNVIDLNNGIYRYLPLEHKLIFLESPNNLKEKLIEASYDQKFVSNCAVTFIWTTIPYRTEWRYSIASSKLILMDAGHMCENLYLACESIDAGTCAIASYDQDKMDKLLHVDGKEEFSVYLAPVGKQ